MSARRFLAWSWTALILGLCWFPRSMMRGTETGRGPLGIPNLDKLVHFGIFFGFAYLWAGTAGGRLRAVLAAGVALAAISELGQMMPFVNRDAGWADGLADVGGVAFGLGAFVLARRMAHRRDRSGTAIKAPSSGTP